MKRSLSIRLGTTAYLLLFFVYLFGPLAVMAISSFNSAAFPRVAPWDCFTTEWFAKLLRDEKLLDGLANSLIIGAGVVALATPIGLAGALALTQVGARLRTLLYTIFIAAILFPGVVIGISTLIFWDRVGSLIGARYDSFFHDGVFLTIIGQVTFISAYTMLVFLSRLQRFDPTQTEAALDLGASPFQAFRKVLLPFLKPAIFSAAILAFLASLENYNTTVFTIVSESTFTTVLASKVRLGIDPSISAVAVIIVALTLVAAIMREASVHRGAKKESAAALTAAGVTSNPLARALGHPATIGAVLFGLLGAAMWIGSQHDASTCKARVLKEKRAIQTEIEQRVKSERPSQLAPEEHAPTVRGPKANTSFGGVFSTDSLDNSSPRAANPAPKPYGGAFSPGNLKDAAPKQ